MARRDVVAWLKDHAVPIATCEPDSGLDDLRPLRPMFAGARVVGLGESTHGTREFFQLKHRLIELLAGDLGVTRVGFEASLPDSMAVDDFVRGYRDDAEAVVTGMRFWTWNTEEVVSLVRWMRAAPHAMRFHGFDIQHPSGAVLAVLDYLDSVDPVWAARAVRLLGPLGNDDRARSFPGLAPAARERTVGFARELCERLHAAGAPVAVRRPAEAVRQGAELLHDLPHATDHRERAMADNLTAVASDGPVVAWAHNGHVQRAPVVGTTIPGMGARLADRFGARYVPVGLVFNRGSFRAQALPGARLQDFTVAPGPADSLDRVLAEVGHPMFAVDLRQAPERGPVADWLATAPPSRTIGSAYAHERDARFWRGGNPRESFDVLVFVNETTASRASEPVRPYRPPVRHRAPVNLDLARGRAGAVPPGWNAVRGPAAGAFRVAVVDDGRGGRAAEVARLSGPWRWGVGRLHQRFDARPWRGQTVRLSVEARVEGRDRTAQAQVRIEVDGAGGGSTVVGSSRWRRYQVEAGIPADARDLTVCVQLAGHGRVLVRAPRFEIGAYVTLRDATA
ncbi:MAG TPA: erythromycin esterase family protein [Acidimicrobiales bacterium]|nr:erythromycin esterase family protein [Acidimicrobiales bacterium]